MAEPAVFSSPQSLYDRHRISLDQENGPPSSPPPTQPEFGAVKHAKTKKPSSVTPRRFTRFFNPRGSSNVKVSRQSKAERRLRDITKHGGNRRVEPSSNIQHAVECNDAMQPLSKRRKVSFDIPSSPPQSSPLGHRQVAGNDAPLVTEDYESDEDVCDQAEPCLQPIRRLPFRGGTQRLLQRSFGGYDAISRGWRGYDHGSSWPSDTTDFVTVGADRHRFTRNALPFCTASCNTNSLIAVGEEEGGVRLIDTSTTSDFAKPHVAFKPHNNAIMDITFNSSDYLLATASGDQTARIIDMHTQQTVCILSGHKSSVKQVRFHPNDDNMVTTSSRDGSVMIWDLRSRGHGSIQELHTKFARDVDTGSFTPTVRFSRNIIDVGSTFRPSIPSSATSRLFNEVTYPAVDGVSITSIQHLSHGREHMLLTTSEVNASIKLWDLRALSRRGGMITPLSSTPPPPSHSRTRNYGINAMLLSGDGARVYTCCRDSVVYAYSTNHLALGCAADETAPSLRNSMPKTPKAGIAPLYGFKNPDFRIVSFYVRAAIRAPRADKSELIAVGCTDANPVLFPTDERLLPSYRRLDMPAEAAYPADLPTLTTRTKENALAGIPIYEHGTALIKGHTKEVTSMSWTHDGALVTVGDDFSARCWREDAARARELRAPGHVQGRLQSGWARKDARAGSDRDDDDDC